MNWESLPEEYRASTVDLWQHHGLFPHTGMDAILGKGKKDISMLMTYVAMEDYLKDRGRLGFVITQSVFKTSGAGQGFRRFRLGSGTPLRVVAVDDMSKLKPFAGASNRTAIVVLARGLEMKYPFRSYSVWHKPGGGAVIPEDVSLEEVVGQRVAVYSHFDAIPVDQADSTSPWMTGRRQALRGIKSVIGGSEYEAHEGVNTGGANAVYWMRIVGVRPDGLVVVKNLTKGAKRRVDETQAAIEPDLIYPLLRGRDVHRWSALPSAHILMVQDPDARSGYPEDWLRAEYPRSYQYLKEFEPALRRRASQMVRRLMDTGAFYSMFGVGNYTFAPHKVVWREQASDMTVAVAGSIEGRVAVPDHKLMLVDFERRDEAHYVCAVLNSSPARFIVLSYGITTAMATHILENVSVASYDPANRVQSRLALLSQEAHEATAAGDMPRVKEIEEEIDKLAAELWGLTRQELEDIKRSLEELL